MCLFFEQVVALKHPIRHCLCWLLALCIQPAMALESQVLSLGTGGVTGVYYPTGGGICRLVNKVRQQHGIRCSVRATQGSVSNLQSVRAGSLDLGITQSNWIYQAYNGTGRFRPMGSDPELRALLRFYPEYFTVLVPSEAAINHFDDLLGKRISIGMPGSSLRATLEALFAKKGWTLDDFEQTLVLSDSEQASALCSGKIDAMIYTVGHPSGAAREATEDCDSRLLAVDDAQVAAMLRESSYYHWDKIPGAIYRGNVKSTPTFGVDAIFFTSSSLSEQAAYDIVKTLFENLDTFRQLHPAFARLEPEKMVQGEFAVPLHPGALRYYREVGLLE